MNTIPLTNAGILDMSLDLLTAGRTELATQGFRKIVAKADACDKMAAALKATRYELMTLMPRLTPAFRESAKACVDMAAAALNKAEAL